MIKPRIKYGYLRYIIVIVKLLLYHKSVESVLFIYFFKEISSLIQQGCIILIKSKSTDFCIVTTNFYFK